MASLLTPRDITKTGKLANDTWLIGTVVRVREFNNNAEGDNRGNSPGQANSQKKGKSKGKGGATKSKKALSNNVGMEIYLNGGDTPADVIILQVWGEQACKMFIPFFKKSEKVKVAKVVFKEHNEKTSAWAS